MFRDKLPKQTSGHTRGEIARRTENCIIGSCKIWGKIKEHLKMCEIYTMHRKC